MTVKRASTGRYRPKDPNLDQRLAVWFSDQRKQGTIKYYFAICANWLTVYIITVNTQHVHVNTLSFNSVLFYFLQDFQSVNSVMLR